MAKAKIFVWICWSLNTLASIVYSAVSLATFHHILQATSAIPEQFTDKYALASKYGWLASCMLGFITVVFFCVYSLFVLVRRGMSSEEAGIGYGFMLSASLHTSLLLLLAGLNLNAAEPQVGGWGWTQTNINVYTASYLLSYILAGSYLFIFIWLFLFKNHIGRQAQGFQELGMTPNSAPKQTAASILYGRPNV